MSPQLPCRRNHLEASRPQTINKTRQTDPYPHTGDDNQSEYSSFEVETIETQWTNEYNQYTDITYLYGGSNNTTSSTAAWLEHRELKQRHYIGKLKKISNKLMSPDAKERAVNVFIENEVPENSRFREILTGVRTAWPSKPRNALFAKLDTIFGCHCVDSMLETIEGKVMLDDDEDESMFTSNTNSMESFVSGQSFKWSAEDAETKEDKDLEISND